MSKILFHENSLNERGTSTAVYDYAYHCRELLDLEPVVCYNNKFPSNPATVEKFSRQFQTVAYDNFSEVQTLVDQIKPEYFYAIKYGVPDEVQVQGAKNLIHSVFSTDTSNIHGDVYAVVSAWQSLKSGQTIPYVPHMLNLPIVEGNLREELGIPKNALVVGRYGAQDTFNIEFVIDIINKILNKRGDIWFVFMNTERKVEHERCLYLDAVVDLNRKVQFINTCDAMLHARDYGETFGLSVLEFAAMNKQIISYDNEQLQKHHPLGGRNHFLFLRDNCFKYQDANQLGYILTYLNKKNPFDTSYLIEEFSSTVVMKTFKKVFL